MFGHHVSADELRSARDCLADSIAWMRDEGHITDADAGAVPQAGNKGSV